MSDLEDLYAQLPRLRDSSHRITSEATDEYNCVAWVSREQGWWEPGFVWPSDVPEPPPDDDVEAYVELFRRWGFELCASAELESGYLKIAIYTKGSSFEHVAKQLPSGGWSSKAGFLHDFRHDELDALNDAKVMRCATPTIYMRRSHDPGDSMELEETGLILDFL